MYLSGSGLEKPQAESEGMSDVHEYVMYYS